MTVNQMLQERSGNCCELCKSTQQLQIYKLPPSQHITVDNSVWICEVCLKQIEGVSAMDLNHWRCLNDSMWSEHQIVQIASWRLLNRIKAEGWPQDLLDMMYLDDVALTFAKSDGDDEDSSAKTVHKDANGVTLEVGDSVVLIKDLKVKGSSMVAKQGTAVRNIKLDSENAEYIEGKVDGQQIVIITKYVKKI